MIRLNIKKKFFFLHYDISFICLPYLQVLEKYKGFEADLNVLPFCSQFIPMDVIDHPKHGSIIYHPSILPRHRGASAINWCVGGGGRGGGREGGREGREGWREGEGRREGGRGTEEGRLRKGREIGWREEKGGRERDGREGRGGREG